MVREIEAFIEIEAVLLAGNDSALGPRADEMMARYFRIPVVPKIVPSNVHVDPNIPVYDVKLLKKEKEIGRGSFGVVIKGRYKGRDVVVKELLGGDYIQESDTKRFVKEARLMHGIQSEHVVKFQAIGYEPLSVMMEYACFDFQPLGGDLKCSGLDKFLSFVNSFKMKSLESFALKIAQDLTNGLQCLHKSGIAHRDLKPGNVLVSNQHYTDIVDLEEQAKMIRSNPIVCKLTDFGESRSRLLQTQTMLARHTNCLQRGTFPFMAPEQFKSSSCASQDQLMKMDIWQLGMIFFCLLNPNLETPFQMEYEEQGGPGVDVRQLICDILSARQKPRMSLEYEAQRVLYWSCLEEAYTMCTHHKPDERADLVVLADLLKEGDSRISILPLSVSQSSAICNFDAQIAAGKNPLRPKNDGTGSCVFLGLKMAYEICKMKNNPLNCLVKLAEDTINSYPAFINIHRDTDMHYEPFEAVELMEKHDLLSHKFELTYDLSSDFPALSPNGSGVADGGYL